jgi:putative NADH-flavin reductase
MKIAIIGANGRTGRMLVRDALASGHEVIAIARAYEASGAMRDNLTKVRADVRSRCPHARVTWSKRRHLRRRRRNIARPDRRVLDRR